MTTTFSASDAVAGLNRFLAAGMNAQAADLARQCRAHWPNLCEFPLLEARAEFGLRRIEQALECSLQAIAIGSNDLRTHSFFMGILARAAPGHLVVPAYTSWLRLVSDFGGPDEVAATFRRHDQRYEFFSPWSVVLVRMGLNEDAIARFGHALQSATAGSAAAERITAEYAGTAIHYDDNALHRASVDNLLPTLVSSLNGATDLTIVDAGCGTGMAGVYLRPHAARLVGIDLSPAMVDCCRATGQYDEVMCDDMIAALTRLNGEADAVACLGCSYYLSDLAPLLSATANALRRSGLLWLIDFPAPDGSPPMQTSGGTLRHCRSRELVMGLAQQAGLIASPPDVTLYFGLPAYFWTLRKA